MKFGDYVETHELEPLSFDEARALVALLGGAQGMPPVSPAAGMRPMRHQDTPLQTLFASLPPNQRQAFVATMNHAWPKPQRNGRARPVDVNGFWTSIATWDDAWAAALSSASHAGETSISIAMRKAKGVSRVDKR